jgi:phosphoribosylformylglycinamidine cyclo-ligase
MNVNDLICLGAKPLLFLDYYACGKLDDHQLSSLLKSIQDACEKSGCSLVGGETAEMPGLYQDNDFDLAGFAVGVAEENQVLGSALVEQGDVIMGIPSSGFHSNGYSLVRTLVEKEKINPNDKPSFSHETWKELLLKPTILYPKMVEPHYSKIHALVHVTGGGLYENLPRVLPKGLSAEIESSEWHIPPLFHWAQKAANLSTEKLLSTFNCGYGLLVVTSEEHSQFLMTQWKQAKVLGKVVSSNSNESQVIWK